MEPTLALEVAPVAEERDWWPCNSYLDVKIKAMKWRASYEDLLSVTFHMIFAETYNAAIVSMFYHSIYNNLYYSSQFGEYLLADLHWKKIKSTWSNSL